MNPARNGGTGINIFTESLANQGATAYRRNLDDS